MAQNGFSGKRDQGSRQSQFNFIKRVIWKATALITRWSADSEDYSPFEEVVVAKLKAPYVEKALKILIEEVKIIIPFNGCDQI